MLKHIPNTITLGNLTCGFVGIIFAMDGDLILAAWLILIAAILDFFDGFAARMLKASSPIGKDLDSLADMVTFGVLPGIIMYQMLLNTGINYTFIAALIPIFSCLRLAQFNNDTRQTDGFIGLPTPANAFYIAALPAIQIQNPGSILEQPIILVVIVVVQSLLLVAPLPLIALKFKHFKWAGNEFRYLLIITAILSVAIFKLIGVPIFILAYLLLSLLNNQIKNKHEIQS